MNSDFDVAVHAMVFLHHKAVTVNSEELAENICTNPGRVRRILGRIKKAGLLKTQEGRFCGGYTYEMERKITLGDISRALNTRMIDVTWHSGSEEINCRVASGMAGYMSQLYGKLNRSCEEYLDGIYVEDVERALFAQTAPGKTAEKEGEAG